MSKKMKAAAPPTQKSPTNETRAVYRIIREGNAGECACGCEQDLKFRAGKMLTQVVCNVYDTTQDPPRWDRVEYYETEHYLEQGLPHGLIYDVPKEEVPILDRMYTKLHAASVAIAGAAAK